MDIEARLKDYAVETESALEAYLRSWDGAPESLVEAVRYSLFAGGKRLRPALALGAAELVAGTAGAAMPAACAIEMIHTYSLIHDDLPAMDDDDLRRGKPTSHKVHGEALAILAGDALLTMSFDVAARSGRADLVQEIAQAAGAVGMVGGQVLDMEHEGKETDLDGLRQIHRAKTGALIRCAVRGGAVMGGANDAALDALSDYGNAIGLAFQIADDLLDVTGDADALGKATGADTARGKATYPSVVGMERARELARESVSEAHDALEIFGDEADFFRALATHIIERSS